LPFKETEDNVNTDEKDEEGETNTDENVRKGTS
jgi:hypothetical protein